MVQRTPPFGRTVSFSSRSMVCPATSSNLNFWKRRTMRIVALMFEKTFPMQILGPQEKGQYTKFDILFLLSPLENLSGLKLSGLCQFSGWWWETYIEKSIFVPLGIWNCPNFSAFVVTRAIPEAGGCLRRLSFSVCSRYSSFVMSSYSTVSLFSRTLSMSWNILKIEKETLNGYPLNCGAVCSAAMWGYSITLLNLGRFPFRGSQN